MKVRTTRESGPSDPAAPAREGERGPMEASREHAPPSSRAENPAAPRSSLDGCRVLVVDDDPLVRMVVRRTLNGLGCVTDTLSNGEDAIRLLEMSPFDLVLLDLDLPGLGGLDVARAIRDPRSQVLDHELPIVALTMRTSEEDRRLCAEAGMNGFVPKPIRVRDLARAIRSQMDARRPRAG